MSFAAIAHGRYYACGLDMQGKAYCWGNNEYGKLGDDFIAADGKSQSPVAVNTSGVLNGKTLTKISTKAYHACTLDTDGKAYCWGYNTHGQLGNGTVVNSYVPVTVDTSGVLAGKSLQQLAADYFQVCGLSTDGQVFCWGSNHQGQLGNNSTSGSSTPVAVDTSGVLSGKTLKQITAGNGHTCALDADGKAYCWGQNTYGQLGTGNTTSSRVPVAVNTSGVLAGKTLLQISGSNDHTCVLDSQKQIYCWGRNDLGQFGRGNTTNSNVAVAVNMSGVLSGKTIATIMTAYKRTCALDSLGFAYCWGNNSHGQLGDNSTTNRNLPQAVSPSATSVYLGSRWCAVSSVNNAGTSLNCTATQALSAGMVAVYLGHGRCTTSVANGYTYEHRCDLAHCISCSSDNICVNCESGYYLNNGQCQSCSTLPNCTTCSNEQTCDACITGYQLNAVGQCEQKCAITSINPDGGPLAGGNQITIAGNDLSNSATSFKAINNGYACALGMNGQAYCWGYNLYGRLGNGTNTNGSVPVAVDTSGVLAGKVLK